MREEDKDPGAQIDPFEEDPGAPYEEDPLEGIPTSREWKHPERLESCPVWTPQATSWQEHSFDHLGFGNPRILSYNCIELARWECPPGYQGFVRIIETALLWSDPEGGIIPGLGEWYPWMYDMVTGDQQSIRFFLRLDTWRRNGDDLAPIITTTDFELPGVPHPQLGTWPDARYDYARGYNPIDLKVPEGHYLRLFVQINTRSTQWENLLRIWGRLGGNLQVYRGNREAIEQSRVPR